MPLLPSRYSEPLTCYGWRFYDKDQVKIDTFCGAFGVSRSVAAIRLEQLGYLNRKKDYEYRDPWRFYDMDQVKIDTFCGVFGVSRSAAAIRLEQLGYLNRKKDYEYRDPLEVWP